MSNTLEQSAADALELNEIARVIFTTGKPLFFDPYPQNKNTGAFILIDPITNNTCAVGMIIDKVERQRHAGIGNSGNQSFETGHRQRTLYSHRKSGQGTRPSRDYGENNSINKSVRRYKRAYILSKWVY